MKKLTAAFMLILGLFSACTTSKKNASSTGASLGTVLKKEPYYEMRIYYAAPGKLEDLSARFRNHTTRIFAKHGMTNIGYWIPVDNPENRLIYVLAYPGKEARDASWKAFGADPEWQAVAKASEVNGKLVTKVESLYMYPTDYSPDPKPEDKGSQRTFELRTYTASPGNIGNLHDRFRNHTLNLFKKHGMTNIAYWGPADSSNASKGDQLIYIIAHKDKTAAEASWKAFREDPVWVAAKNA
ncbi:MAG TPA: NIPSNAP family protein, partial [Segetibacter sp.]